MKDLTAALEVLRNNAINYLAEMAEEGLFFVTALEAAVCYLDGSLDERLDNSEAKQVHTTIFEVVMDNDAYRLARLNAHNLEAHALIMSHVA